MFMLLGIPFNAAAQFEPNITINAQSPVEVRVAPWQVNFTHANGNVTCESSSSASIIVDYFTNCTIGRATVNPPVNVFDGGETQSRNIQITIHLPKRTSSSLQPTAIVNGTWRQGQYTGEIEPTTIDIIVGAFSEVNTFSENELRRNSPGEETVFDVQIENRGNRDDVYLINITNREELEEEGITIDLINEIAVEEGGTEEIEIRVRTPSDILGNWERGSFGDMVTIHGRVSSNTSDESFGDIFYLVLRVEMDAPTYLAIVFSCPGTIITIILIVILVVVVYRDKKKAIGKGKTS